MAKSEGQADEGIGVLKWRYSSVESKVVSVVGCGMLFLTPKSLSLSKL